MPVGVGDWYKTMMGGVRRGRSVGFTKNGNGDREGCDVGSQTDLVMRQKDVII